MRRLGEHTCVSVGDDAYIEPRHTGESVERRVVDAHLVLERGDEVSPVVPPRQPGELARGAVRCDDEGCGHRTRIGLEPDLARAVAHAAHRTRRAQRRAGGHRGRRGHVVQAVAPAGPAPTTATSNMVIIKLPPMTKLAAAATAVLVALSVATACRAQTPAGEAGMDAMDSTDQHTAHAVHEAMSGSMSMDPHLVLWSVRSGSPA